DSYEVPANAATTGTASDGTGKKKGRTVTVTADDMQKRKNDVKARTILLMSLPDEHQLRFSKYKTAQELWAAILKTFGGNETTKKTKKNFLKQQYGNFKAKGSETLEQTFNRLYVIVSQLQFMDLKIEQDDLNQKFLTSLAPEWLMHMIVWRNRSDLDTMSLDDLGNEEVNTASVSTASTNVPTASANIGVTWQGLISQRLNASTAIRWVTLQGSAGLPEAKTEEEETTTDKGNHALVADEEAPTEFALMVKTSAESEDMSWTGLPEFKDDTVTDYSRPSPAIESTSDDAQNKNTSEASPSTISPKPFIKFVKANDSPTKSKTYKAEKAKKPHVRVKRGISRSQNNTHKSFTPRPAVHKPHRPPMRPMRSNMNAARPNRTSFNKPAHSYTKRPFQRTSAVRSQYRGPRVPTVSRNFSTANRKFPTANRKFPTGGTKSSTADMGKKGKAGNSQNNIDDKGYLDSGCSRHMTCNISYLSDYEPFDRGYVSFGQGGCKITGKGTIKTESYEVPTSTASTTTTDTESDATSKKKGRTVTLTAKDMQKRKNDVKARTTLLLSLPDEHQLRFSKYKNAQELWAAILKTFGGNEATKKMKKNPLKQQYGNFKAKGSKTLEQTFNRLQVIVGQLQFLDIEIEQDDLNQKFLTTLAPEWLMHTINMAFISSAKHSRGNEDVNTTSVSTASTNVPNASANIRVASICQETACTHIASQSSGSQIKFKDINQIDEDDMEEMDIKWNMALLSMRADKFWKKTGKKISIQRTDVAWFDKSKVECFNCHKMGHFARECRAPKNQDRGRRDNYRQRSKVEEHAPKALMAIDEVGCD
nr:hypothetical protein [Tanacetum cinerariifolium]